MARKHHTPEQIIQKLREFEMRTWLENLGVKTACIEPGSHWENGYNESFNGTSEGLAKSRAIRYVTRSTGPY